MNQDISRLSSKMRVNSPPGQGSQHHTSRSNSALAATPPSGPKSVYASNQSRSGVVASSANLPSVDSAHARTHSNAKTNSAAHPEISPRKKPRKQPIVATEDPLASNVPMSKPPPARLSASQSAAPAKSAPAAKPQKESIHQFPFRRRMPTAYGGGYFPRGRVALNHFTRASDVRVKGECFVFCVLGCVRFDAGLLCQYPILGTAVCISLQGVINS